MEVQPSRPAAGAAAGSSSSFRPVLTFASTAPTLQRYVPRAVPKRAIGPLALQQNVR